MKALIAFYSKTDNTHKTAKRIADGLRLADKNCEIVFQQLTALNNPKNKREAVKLKECITDWNGFDLVIIGSPVHGRNPSREICAYLKQCKNIKGKNAALFLTCMGFPGKSIKKMSGVINSEGATVIDYLVLRGLLGIRKKKLWKAKEFGKSLAESI